ncbi:GSP1 [Symbiodinium pilosum]|uniref:GSP1 protein n=1 Tax=Symbiodinium pilosum TaxID=2952 RepID=A0A812VZL8_SYMPI|nr:GSP1 [Symbiodinium pilosum]
MPGRAYQCLRPRPEPEVFDGFAEWYGYGDADADAQTVAGQPKKLDGYQEWFGYPDDIAPTTSMYLPDRDPGDDEQHDQSQRLAMEATEMSLTLVQSAIEERRCQLASKHGDEAEQLQQEIHQLKLQQARLARALWSLHEETGTG